MSSLTRSLFLTSFILGLLLPSLASAQSCSNRGELDEAYCDADGDLVADIPAKTRDPSVIVFAYTPVEDPAVYENAFRPFTEYLGKCSGKRVVYYPVQSNSAEIEAMRSARLTVAGFSTGPVGFAVNMAGAVPFAAKGTEKGVEGYNLTRIFSILQVNNRDESAAFAYMKKLRQNIQAYTKSRGGGTVPVGLGQAGGGIFFIVDALFTRQKGYDVQISFPKEGIGSAAECIALVKGNKEHGRSKKPD
jgi:hypothetical protein